MGESDEEMSLQKEQDETQQHKYDPRSPEVARLLDQKLPSTIEFRQDDVDQNI